MRHLFYLTTFLLGFTDISLATIPLTSTSYVSVHRPSPRHTRHRPVRTSTRRYYRNSAGNRVQSPTFYSAPPADATAECRDGSYSFSQSRRGTCSRHGGVKRWL
ncbi:DUF3761 domain-containing protein [uncultured Spirosoma sp.]|uniref:DUF3761 domain-containing protein n=1 Tax=uncultured Spirosoma sp. TaxID=278208 RepID=UPI0033901D10